MKKIILVTAVLLTLGMTSVSAQMPSISKHSSRGVQCTVCHQGNEFKPVPTSQCIVCHNQDALAGKTDRLNFISKMRNPKTGEVKEHKALVNPHNSYHFGKTEDCSDCHREHRTSVNDCAICHDVKAWGMKEPKQAILRFLIKHFHGLIQTASSRKPEAVFTGQNFARKTSVSCDDKAE